MGRKGVAQVTKVVRRTVPPGFLRFLWVSYGISRLSGNENVYSHSGRRSRQGRCGEVGNRGCQPEAETTGRKRSEQ